MKIWSQLVSRIIVFWWLFMGLIGIVNLVESNQSKVMLTAMGASTIVALVSMVIEIND